MLLNSIQYSILLQHVVTEFTSFTLRAIITEKTRIETKTIVKRSYQGRVFLLQIPKYGMFSKFRRTQERKLETMKLTVITVGRVFLCPFLLSHFLCVFSQEEEWVWGNCFYCLAKAHIITSSKLFSHTVIINLCCSRKAARAGSNSHRIELYLVLCNCITYIVDSLAPPRY